MVWIGYAQDDGAKSITPVAHAGFEQGYLDTLHISWEDNDRGRGPRARRSGQVRKSVSKHADRSDVPALAGRGITTRVFLVNQHPACHVQQAFWRAHDLSRVPDSFSESEARLLIELATISRMGITTIRLRAAQAKSEESLRNEHNLITHLAHHGRPDRGLDTQGRIKMFNHSCERATGYTFSEVKDRVFWDFLLRGHQHRQLSAPLLGGKTIIPRHGRYAGLTHQRLAI